MVKLADIFQSGMLLQRDMPVQIWGSGRPGEKIRVTVQRESAETAADAEGEWHLCLSPLEASVRETMFVESEEGRTELADIAVGDVFVAAGQSNMEFWMRYEKHYREALAVCENRNIRFYDMPKLAYPGQEEDFDYHKAGIWRKASEKELAYFSAVGYYFARKLERDLSVPVGVIGCNWGGTRSLTWMKEEHAREIQREQTAEFEEQLKGQSYEEFYRNAGKNPMNDKGNSVWSPFNDFILPKTPSEAEIAEFVKSDSAAGQYAGQAVPQQAPGALYRHMVRRLAPYTVRAVLWYQGESDDSIPGTQKNYKTALDTIKSDWREAWQSPWLPFFVVQLPGFYSWAGITAQDYPVIRECQQRSVDEDANAYLCSISDAGEEFDIHPKDKKVVGERLALLAEKYLFGKEICADAPRLAECKREGRRIILSFGNAEGGLAVEGDTIHALSVADGDRAAAFTAAVSGSELILELGEDVRGGLTVKFAREAWYRVNLYNRAGIPAIPFEAYC